MEDPTLRIVRLPGEGEQSSAELAEVGLTFSLGQSIELVAEDKDTVLEKGEHVFAFSMIVPSSSGALRSALLGGTRLTISTRNTAPYERCQYGRVRHFVTAKARGLGTLGGDVHSNEKELFLIVNVSSVGLLVT